ncbi:MAG: hypothetical protein PVS3B3_13770 [Ktedonobacteraceae bacterium]
MDKTYNNDNAGTKGYKNNDTMYVIYGLEDPSTSKIRYIGLSKDAQKRFKQHTDSRKATSWIKSIQEQGTQPILRILEKDIPDLAKAREREQAWIRHYEEHNCPLENFVGNVDAVVAREEARERYERSYARFAGHLPSEKGHLLTKIIIAGYDIAGWDAWDFQYRSVTNTLNVLNQHYGQRLHFDEIEIAKITLYTFGYKWVGESEVGK